MNALIAEKDASDVVEFRAPGPGERLRSARVSKDMDIRKIADKLHLTTDMVDALERDDYAELPARVFVRGYVRNYARLVELPTESIMQQFDELWPEDETAVKIDRAPRLAADPRPGSSWSRVVTWFLLLLVLGLFLMWWQGYLDRFTQNSAANGGGAEQLPPADVAENPTGLTLPPAPPATPQPETAIASQGDNLLALPPVAPEAIEAASSTTSSAVGDTAQPPPAAAAPTLLSADQVEASVPELSRSVETESAQPESQAIQSTQALPSSEPQQIAEQSAPVEPAVEQGVLVTFNDDCWVDIRGSNRSFKLFGTMREGTQRKLGGQGPYKFVLGNASAVEVLVDGKPFDLAPHTKDNVARFSISP